MGYESRHKDWDVACKVYVGNILKGTTEGELKDMFRKYGVLKNVWVARLPPGFAFVEFEDPRDAQDACRDLDGSRFQGRRIKVEMSHGKRRNGSRYSGGGRRRSRSPARRRRFSSRSKSRSRSRSPRRSPRRSPSYTRGGRGRSRSPSFPRDNDDGCRYSNGGGGGYRARR